MSPMKGKCYTYQGNIGRPFEITADLSNTSGLGKTVISESRYIMVFFICLSTTFSFFFSKNEEY